MTTNYGSSFWKDYVLPYAPEETYFSSAPFGGQITAANPFGGTELLGRAIRQCNESVPRRRWKKNEGRRRSYHPVFYGLS